MMKPGISSERRFSEIEGIRTAYYRHGKGARVVLLHGGAPGACSDLNWFRTFHFLAGSGYDVVAYDQPGFGHSAAPKDHSIEFRYQHAVAFLDSLEPGPINLIGNSIGGLLAVLLSLRRGALKNVEVSSLMLAAPFPHFELSKALQEERSKHRGRLSGVEQTFESIQALCKNTFYDPSFANEDLVRFRLGMLQGDNWLAHKERAKVGSSFNMDSIKGLTVEVPTFVLWGRNDQSVQVEVGIEAMGHLPKAQFLFLPNCAHWPQIEQAEAFNDAAIEFLRRMGSKQSASKGRGK
jgi:2-hydroxy-6-oxonona-2,4-dienedioate hydrolase